LKELVLEGLKVMDGNKHLDALLKPNGISQKEMVNAVVGHHRSFDGNHSGIHGHK
jgi:hypothetical protein